MVDLDEIPFTVVLRQRGHGDHAVEEREDDPVRSRRQHLLKRRVRSARVLQHG